GQGLELAAGRWLPDGKQLLVWGRGAADQDYRLFLLKGDGSPPVQISEAPLSARRVLHLSADGRSAAALDPNLTTLLISLPSGSVARVPGAWRGGARDGVGREGKIVLRLR